ncbi:c-type cytochrome [Pseudidiomarina sp.]|uniref:c-type cytochrome n=1 Tax=Pseudidiomarina sp. TaxID=2081707 RepID=UPI0039A4BC97
MMPQQDDESAIKERIAPIGKVRLAGDSAQSGSGSQTAAAGPRSGQQVYDKFCAACHTPGVLNAPRINNAEDWEPRLAQGMETVFQHAWEGYNAMPAKGTCGDCSKEEIQAAIDYMVSDI